MTRGKDDVDVVGLGEKNCGGNVQICMRERKMDESAGSWS